MLQNITNKYNIILASKSPRRQQLLGEIVDEFTIKTKEVEEIYPPELKREEVAVFLSDLKANAFETDLQDNDLIITSDTIVCLGDRVLGKPKDEQESFEMLTDLCGNTHEVITAVTLLSKGKRTTFYDVTKVTFYPLTEEEIKFYIQKCEPFDKAGSYGIQEWMGYVGIERMEGEFFNVMGLPLHKLYRELKSF